jgi:branched-chain amino acid transport system permease protein
VREDEEAAMAAGINPTAVKLKAFILSGSLTTAGGLLYGIFLSALEPHGLFDIPLSVRIALTAIIGGRGTVWGPLVGAVLLTLSAEIFRNLFAGANLLIYGVLIIIVVLFVPRGLVGEWQRVQVRRRYERAARG